MGFGAPESRRRDRARLKVVSEVDPKRTFTLRVVELTPPTHMTWEGGMPLGLFKGRRTFALTTEGAATRFHLREEYTGPMLPMIWKSMPDLQPSFDKFASGLKARVEARGGADV